MNDLPRLPSLLHDFSRVRGRKGHHRLVGLHFDQRLIFLHRLPLRDKPLDELSLRDPFTDIGEFKFFFHWIISTAIESVVIPAQPEIIQS